MEIMLWILTICNLILTLFLLLAYKNAKDQTLSLYDWVEDQLEMMQYDIDSRYFDFLNYIYQHLHIKEDDSGQPRVIQTLWDEATELRFINFKAELDKKAERLGLPTVQTFHPDRD